MTTEDIQRCSLCIENMKLVVSLFSNHAQKTQHMPFIEFRTHMLNYIEKCERALEGGEDFTKWIDSPLKSMLEVNWSFKKT